MLIEQIILFRIDQNQQTLNQILNKNFKKRRGLRHSNMSIQFTPQANRIHAKEMSLTWGKPNRNIKRRETEPDVT